MVITGEEPSLLDKALDPVHYAEAVETRVAAPPERAFEGAIDVTLGEMRLSAALLLVRSLPRIVTRRRIGLRRLERGFLEALVREPGFLTLVEPHDGLAAFGYVGRPWRPNAEARQLDGPAEFAAFAEAGWAKVVMDLAVRPEGARTILRTETRIHLTDEGARRAFGRYWFVVKHGSNAIRRDWLRAARRRAEAAETALS